MSTFGKELHVPVAQPDRVFGYEPKGRGFESLRARHNRLKAMLSGDFFALREDVVPRWSAQRQCRPSNAISLREIASLQADGLWVGSGEARTFRLPSPGGPSGSAPPGKGVGLEEGGAKRPLPRPPGREGGPAFLSPRKKAPNPRPYAAIRSL